MKKKKKKPKTALRATEFIFTFYNAILTQNDVANNPTRKDDVASNPKRETT